MLPVAMLITRNIKRGNMTEEDAIGGKWIRKCSYWQPCDYPGIISCRSSELGSIFKTNFVSRQPIG
jgi:hypothetical protein